MKPLITRTIPDIKTYIQLCSAVGWEEVMNFHAAEEALKHSIGGVTVYDEHHPVAMGRMVGDGHIYYYIQDVVVDPAYQKQGIGTMVINELLSIFTEVAPANAFIGLFSAPDATEFYQRFGFAQRSLVGMYAVKELLN